MINHGRHIISKWRDGISIFIFGDMQYREGAKNFDDAAWEQFKEEFKSTPGAWGLGLGDYEDWLRPSVRSRLQASTVGDDEARKQLDDKIRRDQDCILRRMDFLEGRLLGLHSGHHEWEFSTGDNSTQRLCAALKAPYLSWMASTRINMVVENHTPRDGGLAYTIVSMHGSGNAQFASTDARFLESRIVPAWIANHYVRGHSCKSIAWSPHERHLIRRQGAYGVIAQTVFCMNVGGFSRAYTDGNKSDYIERAGMLAQPVSYGIVRLHFVQNMQVNRRNACVSSRSKSLQVEQVIRFPNQNNDV